MRIISLAENTSNGVCKAVHGLSLYIETKNHKLLLNSVFSALFREEGKLMETLAKAEKIFGL